MLFSQDEKWLEAKRAAGHLNWLEVIAYYREIGGSCVYVYAIGDKDKRLIVDILNDDTILLLDKNNSPVIDTYENILKSRKAFNYSENYEYTQFYHEDTKYIVKVEI